MQGLIFFKKEVEATTKGEIVFRPVWRSFLLEICLFWLIFPLFIMLWRRYSSKLVVSPEHVTLQRGILNVILVDVAPRDIRSLKVRQNLLERILGYGSLYIGTSATEGYEIIFHGLEAPLKVSNLIKSAGSGE